jgi:hypothetical protein
MKKFFIAASLIGLAGIGTAQAQTARGTFTAPATAEPRREYFEQRTPLRGRTTEVGAIPRARGNPAQMLNPRAPRRYYGHPDETVVADPQNPNRIVGIIFFGLRW